MFEKQVEIGYLLDFYGELLTERRRTLLDMYYNEDMSLSEISAALSITRQGARELIKKAGDELLHYEEKLGAARKFRVIESCAEKAEGLLEDGEVRVLIQKIRQEIKS